MTPTLTRNGDRLELDLSECKGLEFSDAKDKIKEIPGRSFDWDRKVWIVPGEQSVAERVLKTIRPQADETLHTWVREARTQETDELTTPLPDDADLLIPWATKRCPWQPEVVNDEPFDGLYAWQRAAVQHLTQHERAVLADDMGLGKTLQAISAIEEWRLRNGQPDGPKLIIAPNSVKGSWARELRRWLEPDTPVALIDGSSPKARKKQLAAAIEEGAWVIVNWEQLRVKKERVSVRGGGRRTQTVMKEPLFEETEWLAVVADEVHRAKNRKSQQAQGLWRVQGSVMYGLSGTPLMNSPDELWSILRWLWPEAYNSNGSPQHPKIAYWAFYNDFVDFWEDTYGRKVVTGVKNPDALRFALKNKVVRRTASLLGLKGRKRIRYPVELNPSQKKLYNKAETEMWLEVERAIQEGDVDAKKFAQLAAQGATVEQFTRIPNGAARMVRLQQIIENPAILGGPDDSALMDDFVEKFEDSRPNQWVVATRFKPSVTLLAERLRKLGAEVGLYTGDVDPRDRTTLEDRFQKGEVDAIIGTLDALMYGITLTSGHLMYQLTRDFVPDNNEQFESRCDRLGQQELVRVYIPQAIGTVATGKVEPINRVKSDIVRTVLPKDQIEVQRADGSTGFE